MGQNIIIKALLVSTISLSFFLFPGKVWSNPPKKAKARTNIVSDRVEYRNEDGDETTVFIGNVKITREDLVITGDSFTSSRNNDTLRGKGNIVIDRENPRETLHVTAEELDYKIKERYLVLTGQPIINLTQPDNPQGDIEVKAERIEMDVERDHSIAYNKVRITKEDSVITGEKAEFFGEEGKLVVTENPSILKGDNVFTGKEITLYVETNSLIIKGDVKGVMVVEE